MNKNSGIGILEVVIGIGLLSGVVFSFFNFYQRTVILGQETISEIQVSYLLEEGIEAIKLLRDESWSVNIEPLSVGEDYYLVFAGVKWNATSTPELIDGFFERSFRVEALYRDANDNISEFGVLDPGARKLTVQVDWPTSSGNNASSSVSTYVMNIFGN